MQPLFSLARSRAGPGRGDRVIVIARARRSRQYNIYRCERKGERRAVYHRRHERAPACNPARNTPRRGPRIIDWVGSLCDSRLIKMRPSALTGVHLFHQGSGPRGRPGTIVADTCRAGCIKLPPSPPLSPPISSLCLVAVPFARSRFWS